MNSKGHVNNVVYNRYAESGRLQWAQKFANHIDPGNREAWSELWTPKGIGLILRTITTEFKFVCHDLHDAQCVRFLADCGISSCNSP